MTVLLVGVLESFCFLLGFSVCLAVCDFFFNGLGAFLFKLVSHVEFSSLVFGSTTGLSS